MLRFVVLLIACFFAEQCRADVDCSVRPSRNLLRTCCDIPIKLSQIVEKCGKEFPHDNDIPNFCFHKCIFRATGLITNDVIQLAKADSIFSGLYQYLPQLSVAKTAFQHCANKISKNQQQMLKRLEEHHVSDDCRPVSLFMGSCFFPETIKNCPATKWRNTTECNNAKDYLIFCMRN